MKSNNKSILKTGVAFLILLVVLMQGVFCYASEPGSESEAVEITESALGSADETEIIEVSEPNPDSELGYEIFVTGTSEFSSNAAANLASEDKRIKMVIIGDSYAAGYGVSPERSWAYQLMKEKGTSDSVLVGVGGTGFHQVYDGQDFTTMLRNAYGKVNDPASVEWVITCGGYNDHFYDQQLIYNSVVNYIANAKSLFPNAKILIGHVGWEESVATQDLLFDRSIPAYQNAASDMGVYYLSNVESVLANSPDSSYMDGYHPTAKGQDLLKEYIQRFLVNVTEGTELITVRYHRNLDPGDQVVSVKEYPKGSVVMESPFQETEEVLAGWSRFKNYAGAQYKVNQNISSNWYIRNVDEIDLYAVRKLSGTGLKEYRGRWYWFDNGVADMSHFGVEENPYGWWCVRSGKVDFSYTGIAQNAYGWWRIENGKVNFNFTGLAQNEYGWFYFKNGKLDWSYSGFVRGDQCWFYVKGGKMVTGWQKVGNIWYYMDPSSGAMLVGWQYIGEKWYYMNPSGAMLTGWQYIGGKWYYMNSSGAMMTGWLKIGGVWYYLTPSGAMAASEWYGGCWLSANGAWTYQPIGSWKQDRVGWWFGDTSGWYAKNETVRINGTVYSFNANGYWIQ